MRIPGTTIFDNKDVIGTIEFYSQKLGKPKHEILSQDKHGQLWAIWQIALDVAMYTHPRFTLWMIAKMDRKFTTGSAKIEYDDSPFSLHNDYFGGGEFARLARFLQNRWDI